MIAFGKFRACQGGGYRTGSLQDYTYFKKKWKTIAMDLSK